MTLALFVLLQNMPGGPLAAYRSNPFAREEEIQAIGRQLGLDQPVPVQYARWLGQFVRGDWGYSFGTRQPVTTMIGERVRNTATLMSVSIAVALLLSIPLGILAALHRNTLIDHALTFASFLGLSVPTFWLGLLAIIVFSVQLRWLPAGGVSTYGVDTLDDRLSYLVLPVATLSLVSIGLFTRYLRTSMLEVMGRSFVVTARGKGLAERTVVLRHILRNAAIPFVTIVSLHLPELFTGAVVVETIFSWPGIGRLFWDAALRLDYPVLMGVMTIGAVFVVLSNLVADIVYVYLDRRISYG